MYEIKDFDLQTLRRTRHHRSYVSQIHDFIILLMFTLNDILSIFKSKNRHPLLCKLGQMPIHIIHNTFKESYAISFCSVKGMSVHELKQARCVHLL